MADYIEREALLAEYDRQHSGEPGSARKLIEDAPAADVVEVKHGRWIIDKSFPPFVCTCSLCGWSTDVGGAFEWIGCPGCLARMDGE